MSKQSEGVKKWRERTKLRLIEAFGGECCICGYNKCRQALDFHHLNPDEKEMSFGKITAHPVSWEKIVKEIKKCIMVCANCHREIHYGFSNVPANANRYDDSLIDYDIEFIVLKNGKRHLNENVDKCPICNDNKLKKQKTCSSKCAGVKSNMKIWAKVDLKDLMENQKLSFVKIGDMLGITESAVRKRAKKMGLKRCYS